LGIKIVGCTTTGLSKYRSLLAELKPRILLVEEAAETIEGNIIAGMIASLQQLILVGDHQQLRAQCNIEALALEPYNLNVSMFERLVTNGIEFTMLNTQRRMVPNVRGLLCIEPKQDHQQHHPFYRNLNDHPTVLDRINHRPFVPGMGELDTFFYHHQSTEGKNDNMSKLNEGEAEMIVGVFSHLVLNGTDPKKITVLTVSAPKGNLRMCAYFDIVLHWSTKEDSPEAQVVKGTWSCLKLGGLYSRQIPRRRK
jgi:helicase required for RNAi-mediated heterochromatin assembly 1